MNCIKRGEARPGPLVQLQISVYSSSVFQILSQGGEHVER